MCTAVLRCVLFEEIHMLNSCLLVPKHEAVYSLQYAVHLHDSKHSPTKGIAICAGRAFEAPEPAQLLLAANFTTKEYFSQMHSGQCDLKMLAKCLYAAATCIIHSVARLRPPPLLPPKVVIAWQHALQLLTDHLQAVYYS